MPKPKRIVGAENPFDLAREVENLERIREKAAHEEKRKEQLSELREDLIQKYGESNSKRLTKSRQNWICPNCKRFLPDPLKWRRRTKVFTRWKRLPTGRRYKRYIGETGRVCRACSGVTSTGALRSATIVERIEKWFFVGESGRRNGEASIEIFDGFEKNRSRATKFKILKQEAYLEDEEAELLHKAGFITERRLVRFAVNGKELEIARRDIRVGVSALSDMLDCGSGHITQMERGHTTINIALGIRLLAALEQLGIQNEHLKTKTG